MVTQNYDPQLHVLRSISSALADPRQRSEAMSARFHLFTALENGDEERAQDWLEALAVALRAALPSTSAGMASAERAIAIIRKGLDQTV